MKRCETGSACGVVLLYAFRADCGRPTDHVAVFVFIIDDVVVAQPFKSVNLPESLIAILCYPPLGTKTSLWLTTHYTENIGRSILYFWVSEWFLKAPFLPMWFIESIIHDLQQSNRGYLAG